MGRGTGVRVWRWGNLERGHEFDFLLCCVYEDMYFVWASRPRSLARVGGVGRDRRGVNGLGWFFFRTETFHDENSICAVRLL